MAKYSIFDTRAEAFHYFNSYVQNPTVNFDETFFKALAPKLDVLFLQKILGNQKTPIQELVRILGECHQGLLIEYLTKKRHELSSSAINEMTDVLTSLIKRTDSSSETGPKAALTACSFNNKKIWATHCLELINNPQASAGQAHSL